MHRLSPVPRFLTPATYCRLTGLRPYALRQLIRQRLIGSAWIDGGPVVVLGDVGPERAQAGPPKSRGGRVNHPEMPGGLPMALDSVTVESADRMVASFETTKPGVVSPGPHRSIHRSIGTRGRTLLIQPRDRNPLLIARARRESVVSQQV